MSHFPFAIAMAICMTKVDFPLSVGPTKPVSKPSRTHGNPNAFPTFLPTVPFLIASR